MALPPDLHPDDTVARLDLRAKLRGIREDRDLSMRQVSRLAGFGYIDAVRDLERNPNWEAWRVQQWARGLQYVFQPHLNGLTVAEDDTRSLVFRTTTAFGGFDEDQLWLRILAADLQRTREARGVTRVEFAARCRVDERAVREFEASPLQSWLRTYQRYARALGGSLGLELKPVAAFAGTEA